MKEYLSRFVIFLLVGFLLLGLVCEGIMRYPQAFNAGYFNRWFSTYQVISKSHEKIDSDTLFIGDSVAGQIFRPENRKNHIAYTAAILMPGHYIIAANAIKANPDLKSIVLISGPLTIGFEFEQFTTYPYFIKPFYKKEYFPHISEHLQTKIDGYPYSEFYQYSMIKLAPFADVDCTSKAPKDENYALSKLSIEYLKKLNQLCQEYDIELRILSGPIEQSHFEKTNDWAFLRNQIKEEGLESLFKGFFESIKYLEKDKFIDGFHIKTDQVLECKAHLMEQLQIVT